jgi:hypothetical protein
MQSVACAHCGGSFPFDPAQIWNSPGQITRHSLGGSQKVVIQCPKCQQWLTVDLKEGKSNSVSSKKDS